MTTTLLLIIPGVAFLGLLMFLLLKRPALALAMQYVGFSAYFYLMYKFGLEPTRLTTGLFLLALAIAHIVGGGILVIKSPTTGFRLNKTDLLFFVLWIWIGLDSVYRSVNLSLLFTNYLIYAPLLAIAPFLGARLIASAGRYRSFLAYCVWIPAILFIPFLYEALANAYSLVGTGHGSLYTRFAPFQFWQNGQLVGNHVQIGYTFAIPLLILLVRIFERNLRAKWYYICLIIAFQYMVIRSTSQGVIFASIIALAFYAVFLTTLKNKMRIIASAVIIGVPIILILLSLMPSNVLGFFQVVLQGKQVEYSSVVIRLHDWREAWHTFLAHPWTGIGVGNFHQSAGNNWPHNLILETAMELGIVGAVLAMTLWLSTFYKAWKLSLSRINIEIAQLFKILLVLLIFTTVETLFRGRVVNQTYLFLTMGLIWGAYQSTSCSLTQNK